eukprot:g80836.t1
MLNLDQKALVPFTVKCPDLQGQLVKSLAKLMQNSDQHTGSRAESDATESDEHASIEVFVNKEPTQEIVELKAQLVSVKGKLSEAEAKIHALMEGDKEAKRVVDNSLSLLDDERKAKLKAQAELLELRKTSAKDRASLERNNYDNLSRANGHNKTTNKELRKEVTDLKKQVAALEQEESEALQLAGKEKASLLSQLGNLKTKITELEGLLEEANAQLDESQTEIAALKDKYKAVKEDLNTAKAEARGKSADTCLAFTNNLLLFVHVLQLQQPMSKAKGTGLSHSHLTHVDIHHYRGRHYKPLSKRAKCDRSSDSESECTKKTSPNKRHGHH